MASPRPAPQRRGSYLTPSLHDDAGSIHSAADSDSDDDSVLREARTSADIRAHDRNILFEEEERDRMLTEARQPQNQRRGSGLGISNPFKKLVGQSKPSQYDTVAQGSSDDLGQSSGDGKREQRRRRRKERKERLMMAAEQGEDRGLLYEMEEGDMKEGSETGDSSDTEGLSNEEKAHLHDNEYTGRRRWGWKIWTYVTVMVLLFIALLVLGAWRLSVHSKKPKHEFAPVRDGYQSNGTALFKPTTILVSLDGFRADYIQRGLTPALSKFMAEGVAPEYMNPSFPSLTFPNHYTLITGLYPESHGIVANKFWDPKLGKEFKYTDPAKSRAREWWSQAEPLWATAEKAGIKTAIHMWPGSEAATSDIEPSIVDKYSGKQPLDVKLNRVFDMLDMPGVENNETAMPEQRPQFIATYVPNIDAVGHKFGPNSTQVNDALVAADGMLSNLFAGIEQRNLTNIVNIVIVSDHGMAESSNDRLIQIDDIITMDMLEHVDGWPLYGLRPKEPVANNALKLYKRLLMAAVEYGHVFDVYQKDHMPDRWHFRNNERIAPVWIIPKTGWAFVTKEEFNVEKAKETHEQYSPKGIHGYDHEDPQMRAIFAARGPAFKDFIGKKVAPFQNTEVYNIICDSLYLTPRPNNGTLNFLRQPAAELPGRPSPGVPSLSGSVAISSDMSSLSSALSSVSTEIEASSTVAATSSTAVPENPLKKPALSIYSDVASMSSAWQNAASAVFDRPVINETPAAVEPSSTAVVVPVPAASKAAVVKPGEEPADDDDDEEEHEADDDEVTAEVPAPQPEVPEEQEGKGSGGWWDWVKTKVGDAKDWVVGLLPGANADDADEKSE